MKREIGKLGQHHQSKKNRLTKGYRGLMLAPNSTYEYYGLKNPINIRDYGYSISKKCWTNHLNADPQKFKEFLSLVQLGVSSKRAAIRQIKKIRQNGALPQGTLLNLIYPNYLDVITFKI